MNPKSWILLGVTVVLGICYVVFNTEWLNPDPIQIQAQVREISGRASLEPRSARPSRGTNNATRGEAAKARKLEAAAAVAESGKFNGMYPVVFALDGEYQLTSVLVIEDTPSVPGKGALIVWQLTTSSNSVPTKALLYGKTPRGMQLKDDRNKAAKLKPGVTYRLEVRAGRYKGQTTFQAKENTPVDAPEAN